MPDERPAARGGKWRAFLSAFCIVLAAVLVPVSILGAWARAELVDESRFVATLAPLAQDPQVQGFVIEETRNAIDERVDFDQLTGSVVGGLDGLGLPPRAVAALNLLSGPAADGLRDVLVVVAALLAAWVLELLQQRSIEMSGAVQHAEGR